MYLVFLCQISYRVQDNDLLCISTHHTCMNFLKHVSNASLQSLIDDTPLLQGCDKENISLRLRLMK